MNKDTLFDFSITKHKHNLIDLDFGGENQKKDENKGVQNLNRLCQFCGKNVPTSEYNDHVPGCMDKNNRLREKIISGNLEIKNEKLCTSCNKNIDSSAYLLHTAQCNKNKSSEVISGLDQIGLNSGENSDVNKISSSGLNSNNNFNIVSNNTVINPLLNNNPFMIVKNQTKPVEENQINPYVQNSESNFRLLSSNSGIKVPSLNDNPNLSSSNINLLNSFMLINSAKKENDENKISLDNKVEIELPKEDDPLSLGFGIVDNRNNISNNISNNNLNSNINLPYNNSNIQNQRDEKICPICFKTFENNVYFELHVRNCLGEDEDKKWDNFGSQVIHGAYGYGYGYGYYPEDDIYDHNDHHDHSLSYNSDPDHDVAHNDQGVIDFNNPNLGYEDLLLLDENIKHPLPLIYLSQLPEEKLTQLIISKLNEDNKQCMICFENFEVDQKFIRLPCTHLFHSEEILNWFKTNKTCPICRLNIEAFFKGEIDK